MDVSRLTSVSRPTVYNWINRGLIKSVSLKEPGQIRGARLVYWPSVEEFLLGKATGGEEARGLS